MNQMYINRLSSLLREIEIDLGATDLSILCLKALRDTLKELHPRSLHDFDTQLEHIVKDIQSTQPRYAIVIDGFIELLKLVHKEDQKQGNKDYEANKEKFLKYLKKLIKEHKNIQKEIIKQSNALNFNNKTILIYHHSVTLEQVLLNAKKNTKNLKIIVAEQDQTKTGANIDFLHQHNFNYKVVPSYMISHFTKEIDLILLGALTLNSDMKFVTDTGTNAIISQFYLQKTPIYMFMASQKFSLWKLDPNKHSDIFAQKHKRTHHCKNIDFKRVKFSHDRIELKMFDKIITERGILTPEEIETCFNEKLKKRLAFNKKIANKQ